MASCWIKYLAAIALVTTFTDGQEALQPNVPTIKISSSAIELQTGESTSIRCLVVNPDSKQFLFWMKRQGSEEVQMGTNNFLVDAFKDTGRYTIDTEEGADDTVTFVLTIKDAVAEDSGDIGCTIPGIDNSEQFVTVDVVVAIDNMKLLSLNTNLTDSLENPVSEYKDGDLVLFHIGQLYYFGCISSGSNPKPKMVITIGDTDVSSQFREEDKIVVAGDTPGLNQMTHTTQMISNSPVLMDYYSKAQTFKCVASVPGFEEETIEILPKLEFKPQIICADKLEAPLYEDDVVLECELLSMPPPEEITWTWYESEDMPVSVHQGEVSGVIKARLMPGEVPGRFVTTLTIAHSYPQHFRYYKIDAKNGVGSSSHTLELVIDKDAVMKEGASAVQTSITLMVMLVVTALFARA